MRLNILTPGFKSSNGTAFLFPLIVWRKELLEAGIEVFIYKKLINKLYECDFLCIDSKFFADGWQLKRRETENIFLNFQKKVANILYFDTTDSTGMDNTYAIPFVKSWIKNQLLLDKEEYLRPIAANGRIFAEFPYKKGYVKDNTNIYSVPIKNRNDLKKLKLGWNSGMSNYSLLGPLKRKIIEKTGFYNFLSFSNKMTSPYSYRKEKISSRFGIKYRHNGVSWNRKRISEILNFKKKSEKVNKIQYFNELKNSKIIISPFGLGEITLKDFEVFITGGLLFKPSLEHMETWPPFFVKDKTYIPYKWDLSDFSSRLESLNNDSEKRIKIAYNAQKNYTKFTSSNGASIHFINHLKGILN